MSGVTVSGTKAGSLKIKAAYSGDPNNQGSSRRITLIILKAK